MKRKPSIHSSWLIAVFSATFIVGAYLSLYTTDFARFEWLFFGLCAAAISFVRRDNTAIILMIIAGLLCGLWRAGIELRSQDEFAQFFGSEVTITGKVSDDPSIDSDGDTRLKITDVQAYGAEYAGSIWVSTSEKIQIKRSDRVEVDGLITKGFGTINAAMYRGRIQKVTRQDYADVGRDARDAFAQGIRKSIKEPEASLGAGFLLGQKSEIPEKLDNELRLLGLTHIIVASGYNLTILIRFARRLFAKVSRFTALAASALLIFGFVQMTGFSPSMTRASLITSLSLVAWYFGRKFHPFVLLPFSAAITVLVNPAYAWGDIGWLLSFTSFIGVILLSPLIHGYFWGDKKAGTVRQVFIETMSAQLLTLPIIAYVFGQYSILSLPANVLILPLIPLAMGLTFVAGIAGSVTFPAVNILGLPAELLMGYMTTIVGKLAQLPQAGSELQFSITTVIVFYLTLFVVMVFLCRRTGYRFRDYNVIE